MKNFNRIGFNLNVVATDQNSVLKELARLAQTNGNTNDSDLLYRHLLDREKEGTTGFGNHIAVPHAKSASVTKAGILVARSSNKIEWNSIDEEPVNTWICLLTPREGGTEHLQLLAKVSRKLMNSDFTDILKKGDEETIIKAFEQIL